MYTACTYKLAQAMQLPFLFVIPRGFIYIAFAAWALTFFGMLRNLVRVLLAPRSEFS